MLPDLSEWVPPQRDCTHKAKNLYFQHNDNDIFVLLYVLALKNLTINR